jgi:adenine deaminase
VFFWPRFSRLARSQSVPTASTAGQPNSVSVAILAGRLIDMHTGHVTTNAYIVVEKDRIARIVAVAPAGMKVLDLSKYTVVPGTNLPCLDYACRPAKQLSGVCTT